ncbi:MAG: HK97 family phage prohead protease [Proteobacteria bacterium]|nr:HK97 family phage prohead protease [Pseudomonadota bacterium]
MPTKHLAAPFEIKELGANGYVCGYASVFNAVDAQREAVLPGAFRRTLKEWKSAQRNPAMLWMHNAAQPVGVWENLAEDSSGLAVEGRLAIRTQHGADAYELLKMGAVTGLSIGYRTVQSKIDSKNRVRALTDVDLFEVSLVTFPANDLARIRAVKIADDEMGAIVARLQRVARLLREGE